MGAADGRASAPVMIVNFAGWIPQFETICLLLLPSNDMKRAVEKSGLSTAHSTGGIKLANRSQHVYEVRPRKDGRGFDLVSDVLPFGEKETSHGMVSWQAR
jgi:hypothetical protein